MRRMTVAASSLVVSGSKSGAPQDGQQIEGDEAGEANSGAPGGAAAGRAVHARRGRGARSISRSSDSSRICALGIVEQRGDRGDVVGARRWHRLTGVATAGRRATASRAPGNRRVADDLEQVAVAEQRRELQHRAGDDDLQSRARRWMISGGASATSLSVSAMIWRTRVTWSARGCSSTS